MTPTRKTPDLSGTDGLDHSKSDDPGHALDDATSSMRRFKRNAVRKRLGGAMKPADTLRIAMHGDTIVLATSGRLHLSTGPGAAPTSRTGENGHSVQLASSWDGDTLVVKTTAEKFQREAHYSLAAGGNAIRIAITMSAGGSAGPFHYALVYDRVAADTTSP